ncbi:MAG: endo-1,3-alpha-glucanase family glycosylhydrolase, partial [Verrucomicrobiota bacterium]|nr:endo-1,3-alpha-glucanase family glycosylhydrolase [Verrucomicrobiota bacterium]
SLTAGIASTGHNPHERRIYAHYMGCAPAGNGAIHYYKSKTAEGFRGHTNAYQLDSYSLASGGYYDNWPLVPSTAGLSPEENARLEISRARRFGIDGFAFDAWAGGKSAMDLLDVFFRVAEEMKVDFGLTICFDPSCHGGVEGATQLDKYVNTAKFVLRHRDSPNLARMDGRPLFFGYYSSGIDYAPKDKPLAERLRREKEAWTAFRERIGEPVFLHGSMDAYALDKSVDWKLVGRAAAEIYDAVGGFLGTDCNWGNNADLIAAVRAGGKTWSQPMFYQYSNKSGGILTRKGLSWLRDNWAAAIANDSRLIQFVTWNDYGEETILAPSTGGAYTVPRINAWYVEKWKTGKDPQIEKDEVHVVYRRAVGQPEPFPLQARRVADLPTCLEVTTFLIAPARVQVKGYGDYDAPAGMFVKEFELKTGLVAVRVRRGEGDAVRTVCGVIAPERVSEKRWREDFTLASYGSNYDEEWTRDFPGKPVERYAENGDADGDGLPNWFEMFYFGRYPYFDTATVADPKGDPDGDGLTNLEEYLGDTDPTKLDTPYPKGFSWDAADVAKAKYCWNPARDDHRKGVWLSLHGREEDWRLTPVTSGAAKWRTFYDPQWKARIHFATNGVVELHADNDCPIAFAWRAPVAGTFEITAAVRAGKGGGKLRVALDARAARLVERSLAAEECATLGPLRVKLGKGERVILSDDCKGAWGLGALHIESFRIVRK